MLTQEPALRITPALTLKEDLLEEKINYVRSFNSVVLAAKYLNINKRIIYRYLNQGILIRKKKNIFILSNSSNSSTLPSLSKLYKISIRLLRAQEKSSKVFNSKYFKGKSIFIYTQDSEKKDKIKFLGEFFNQEEAALAVGCSTITVARYLQSRKIYTTKNKLHQDPNLNILFSYSFLPLPLSGNNKDSLHNDEGDDKLQNLFKQTKKLHSSTKPVFIYIKKESGLEFFNQYESIRKASIGMEINCSPQTITNYLDKGLLYKNKFLFSTSLLNT